MKFEKYTGARGIPLDYHLSLPENFDGAKEHPSLLALPPGAQDAADASVYAAWLPALQAAGWATLIPLAPGGKLFFRGSESKLPGVLDRVSEQIKPTKGKFALFGVSNGGVSAFRLATLFPERFHSITVMPGWPKPADAARLEKILHLPINFIVGEMDANWRAKSEQFAEHIEGMGGNVTLEIVPAEGHMAFQRYPIERLISFFSAR